MSNRPKKPRNITRTPGYWAAKRALERFGSHVIDGRSRVALLLDEFRDKILADLGGPEAVSQQERVIVDLAVRTHLMVSSLDNYLLSLGSLVNKRKRALWPVVRERAILADSLARYMGQLGLQKRGKPIPSLSEYLNQKEPEATSKAEAQRAPDPMTQLEAEIEERADVDKYRVPDNGDRRRDRGRFVEEIEKGAADVDESEDREGLDGRGRGSIRCDHDGEPPHENSGDSTLAAVSPEHREGDRTGEAELPETAAE
jgi:hypothetical protein